LEDKEKRLAKRQPQELATVRKRLEELQAARAVEAQKVWDFLSQNENALVPFGFSPLHSRDPVREVSIALPLLDSIGAKMLKLEEVIGEQLEAEDHALAETVAEHVLTCFQSRDLLASLEPIVQGPVVEMEETARASVQNTTKLVAARFERQIEDA
jgi:hypothetical protein